MDKLEKARALRGDKTTHYNCCQAVVMACAEDCGMDDETARRLSAHFGAGMRHGSTCGAVTGALMVLGLLDRGEEDAQRLIREFRNKNHHLDCATLLAEAANNGEARAPHCDRMVCGAVALVEEILK